MKRNIFLLKGDSVIHNSKIYELDMFIKDFKCPKRMDIYILDEDLFIHDYPITTKLYKNNTIDNIIKSVFGTDEDYLFDYKLDYKNKLVNIYAIKGGNRVSRLCANSTCIEVTPLQFEIWRKVKRKFKYRDYKLIYLFNGTYYFMEFKNRKLNKSFVKYVLDDIKDVIRNSDGNKIYIDSKIEGLNIKNTEKIDIRSILDEKILS